MPADGRPRPAAQRRGAEYAAAGNAGRRTGDRRCRRPQAGRTPAHHSGGGPRRQLCRRRRCSGAAAGRAAAARACSHRRSCRSSRCWSARWSCRSRRSCPCRASCPAVAMVTPERAAVEPPVSRRAGGAGGGQAVGARRGRERPRWAMGGGWPWSALTMMSPNCSGSVSRPRVSIGSWNGCVRRGRRLADLPGRGVEVLAADGVGHVDGGHVAATPASAGRARRGCCSRAGPGS